MLQNLKLLRQKAGISQKALAEAIGVSQQSVNKYENHNIEPDIATLILIADYFSTSVDFLVGHSAPEVSQAATLNADESKLLERYRRLPPDKKKIVQSVTGSYL